MDEAGSAKTDVQVNVTEVLKLRVTVVNRLFATHFVA